MVRRDCRGAENLIPQDLRGENLHDLRSKTFCATGCWMANAVRMNTNLLKLRSGDFSQGNDFVSRK